jgi:hypothetical protein
MLLCYVMVSAQNFSTLSVPILHKWHTDVSDGREQFNVGTRCHRDRIVWFAKFYVYMQSVSITTKVVSINPAYVEVYPIKHVIKFASDLRQVGGFLRVLRFPPPIKLTATIYMY